MNDRRVLRKILGDGPLVDPGNGLSGLSDDEAWRRLQVELSVEPRAIQRPPWWLAIALGAGLAGAAALFVVQAGQPTPAPVLPAATAALPPAPPRPLPAALPPPPALPTAGVEADGAAVSVSDGQRATLVAERQEIAEGSRVVTAHGEAKLRFPGGSVTLLEADTQVRLARLNPDDTEIELESGAIFVHAAPLGARQLAVRTGAYRVIVHGTGFRVERKAGEVEVGLWHGSVEIRADGAAAGTMLEPGHRLRFNEARGLAGVLPRSLDEAEEAGAAEEAHLLGLPAPAPKAARHAAPVHKPAPQSKIPPAVLADVARCRAQVPAGAAGIDTVRLDLTLGDDGQVLSAAAERDRDARLASCVAEAALHWKLDAPPPALRGMQFVYAVPVK